MTRVLEVALRPLEAGQDYIHEKGVVAWRMIGSGQAPAADPFAAGGFEQQRFESDFRPANALFNALQDAPVGERTLLEHVWWDGVSMWQFVPAEIWADVFRALEIIRCLDRIVKRTSPSALLVHPARDHGARLWHGCCVAFAHARGLGVRHTASETADWRESALARGVLRPLWRALRGRAAPAPPFADEHARAADLRARLGEPAPAGGAGRTLLFLGNRAHWRVRADDAQRKYDNQLYPLLPALREAGWSRFAAVDCFTHDEKLMRERIEHAEDGVSWRGVFEYRPEGYDARPARRAFARQYAALRACPRFAAALHHDGVALWPALEHRMRLAFQMRLPEAAYLRALARTMIARERPQAVLATGETSPVPRAALIEAGRAGVPSVGLQHGNMFDNHYNYMHRRIRPSGEDTRPGFEVPTRFCTWGPLWRRNLVEHGDWPARIVIDTGLWQLDPFHGEARARLGRALRARNGIGEHEPLVLVIASKLEVVDFVRRTLEVLRARGRERYLVRIHPQDDPVPVAAMLAAQGHPASVLSDENTHALLAASDVVVSQLTTVISEALFFDRPVVLVDYQGMDGWDFYKRNAACLQAGDEAALDAALDQLQRADTARRLGEARREFVADLFYRDDGRAGERVAAVFAALSDTAGAAAGPGS